LRGVLDDLFMDPSVISEPGSYIQKPVNVGQQ
jgi:hypothetical protein